MSVNTYCEVNNSEKDSIKSIDFLCLFYDLEPIYLILPSVPFSPSAELNLHSQEAKTCQIIYSIVLKKRKERFYFIACSSS